MPFHWTYLSPFSYAYSYPQTLNYMVYRKPWIYRLDCECDDSETYSECQQRKRMFHC